MMRPKTKLDPTKTGTETEQLESSLKKLVVGQDEAVQQIADIHQMHLAGLNAPGRPIGTFLFLGPTGTGKTRIVQAVAECLAQTPRAVVKIDCGEFQHSHEIAKLVGSPPGYLGHRETHPMLSQEMRNQHHSEKCKVSFVLFDEIEKASDALWNLLLGILDKATLTLGDNRKVDFSRAIPGGDGENTARKISNSGLEAARRKFPPEFLNRVDKIVVFHPLGQNQLRKVLDIELNVVQRRVFESAGVNAFVLQAIERLLVHPMSNLMATDQIHGGDTLCVDFDSCENQLVFLKGPGEPSARAAATGN